MNVERHVSEKIRIPKTMVLRTLRF